MIKLQSQFKKFYEEIRIHSETEQLIDKKNILDADLKEYLPSILEEHGISINQTDIRMIDQGSYKYNTTIKSDVVDRDRAVIFPLDITENSNPIKIKEYLKETIDRNNRTVVIKEPCVTAQYFENGEEWLHIDMPLYVKDNNGLVYLARGKHNETGEWQDADPDGLNDYMCTNINGHEQLRRIICYIKKWKNEVYSKTARDNHEAPPSVGLTLLAIDYFIETADDGKDDDLTALYKTMNNILSRFYKVNDDYQLEVKLPVTPYSDVFKKMKEANSNSVNEFHDKLSEAVNNLENAINVSTEHDAATYVSKVLGNDFEIPPKEAKEALTKSKTEHSFG